MRSYQPALLGGLFIGVLSSLPLVSGLNVCCCLWVIVGGVLTVYLQQQRPNAGTGTGPGNDTSEAVIGGLVAGLVGGVIQTVLSVALFSMAGGTSPAEIQDALSRIPQLPPEMRDRIVRMFTGGGFLAVAAVVTLPIYAVFGMIGGLLGLAIFRKKPTPPAPTPPQFPQP